MHVFVLLAALLLLFAAGSAQAASVRAPTEVAGRGKPKPKSRSKSTPGHQRTRPHGRSRKKAPKPTLPGPIASLAASQETLPSTGGSITLTYSSANARACVITSNPIVTGADNPIACSGTLRVQIPAQVSGGAFLFTFTATGVDRKTAVATQTVTERARPTATLTLSTTALTSSGGPVTLTYSASNASSCTLSASPQLWSGSNPAPVSCTGTYQAVVPSASSAEQWTLTFTAGNDQGETATATQTLSQSAPVPQYHTSPNWSGYALPSSTLVTGASGQFQVPFVHCSDAPTGDAVAEWVGIGGGGPGTGDLLQTGVTSQCLSGVQEDFAWWEEYPGVPGTDFNGMTVYPGDTVRATVLERSDGAWQTRVDDLTTGVSGVMITGSGYGIAPDNSSTFPVQGSTTSLSYGGGYTAEWIVEDFTQGGSMVNLANYGTVTFADLTTSLSSWSLLPGDGVAIADSSGDVVSTPSLPSGSGFSVSFTG